MDTYIYIHIYIYIYNMDTYIIRGTASDQPICLGLRLDPIPKFEQRLELQLAHCRAMDMFFVVKNIRF